MEKGETAILAYLLGRQLHCRPIAGKQGMAVQLPFQRKVFLKMLPFFPFPLFPSYTDVKLRRSFWTSGSVVWAMPARTTFANGLPLFTRREQPDGRNWLLPCTFQGPPKTQGFPPSDEGVPQAVDSRGPFCRSGE
jgi:hypothetical protein